MFSPPFQEAPISDFDGAALAPARLSAPQACLVRLLLSVAVQVDAAQACRRSPRLREVRDWRGQMKRRDTMRLITASDLASLTLSQLSALYRMISDELAETEHDSIERANMLASLKIISRAIASRKMSGPKF